ncbi:MAG: helix-turn-helix domain-containing protein, partial [Peptostreptococcaceae bacterium]
MPAPRLILPKENLVELIDKGYNQKEMMKELNIARQTLNKLLNEYDLKIKGKPDEMIGKRFGKLVVTKRLENSK